MWRCASSADVPDDAPRRFLGIVGDDVYFTATVEPDDRDTWQTLRDDRRRAPTTSTPRCSSARSRSSSGTSGTRTARCAAPPTVETQAGWTRTCTADGSEHFPRTDPAVIMLDPRRRRPRTARPRAAVGRGTVLDAGRLRRAGGVARGGGGPRGVRGGRRRHHRHPLSRQPAVAVPGVAHARLRRPPRRRSGDHPRPGRDGRGRVVHPRRDRAGARLDRRGTRRPSRAGGCARSRRTCRSRATSSTGGWPARSDQAEPAPSRL